MADAERSLLFVIKANIEDYNKKIGDAERGFKKSFGNIQSVMLSVGKTFAVAVAGMVTALSIIVVKSVNFADELVDIGDAIGMTTDEVQKLAFALRLEGEEVSTLLPIMKFFSEAMEKAADSQAAATEEGKAFNDAFTQLGINLTTFKTLGTAEQLDILFRAIANVSDANERATLTTDIFGRSGMDLLPVIQDWADNQDRLNQLLKDFGIPEDALRDMADMKTDMEAFKIALDYIGLQITKDLMPALKVILPYLKDFAVDLKEFLTPENIGNLEELAKCFVKMGEVILWATEKLLALNKIIGNILHPSFAPLFAPEEKKNRNLFKLPTISPGAEDTEGIEDIPAAQYGAIFTRPTLAMVGEVPEIAMPLSRLGSMGNIAGGGGDVHVHIHGDFMGDEMALRELTCRIEKVLRREGNRSVFGPSKTEPWVKNHL